jgi:hypothetical protein
MTNHFDMAREMARLVDTDKSSDEDSSRDAPLVSERRGSEQRTYVIGSKLVPTSPERLAVLGLDPARDQRPADVSLDRGVERRADTAPAVGLAVDENVTDSLQPLPVGHQEFEKGDHSGLMKPLREIVPLLSPALRRLQARLPTFQRPLSAGTEARTPASPGHR